MAFEPIQPSSSSISLSGGNKGQLEGSKLNKPTSLLDTLNSKPKDSVNDQHDKDDKDRDRLSLSAQAQEFLKTSDISSTTTGDKFTQDKAVNQALEFRGLNQIAKTRQLTDTETTKLNEIKENFAQVGLTEKDINRVADKRLTQISEEAPQLIQQLDTGNITGDQFAKLNTINESLNKANGFGVTPDDTQSDTSTATTIESTRQNLNSILDASKDSTLPQPDLTAVKQIAQQLGTIQGFQLNVLRTVGPEGVVI